MEKRGVEMSLQTVVTAVLVLLILALLIWLVLKAIRGANTSIEDCTSRGGECRTNDCNPGEQSYPLGDAGCVNAQRGDKCCITGGSLIDSLG